MAELLYRVYSNHWECQFFLARLRGKGDRFNFNVSALCTHEIGAELQEMMTLGFEAEALSLLGEMEASDETLNRASKITKKQRYLFPVYRSPYLVGRFVYDIAQLQKEILSETPSNIPNTRRNAYRSGKVALKNSRKYAPYRTKIYRLMGLYY